MAELDSLAYDNDTNSQFIIIQSCLKDERHNVLIQNSKNITLLEDNLTFNLGDSFDSYDALITRLEAHSKQSSVYYWLRDSRTISGARSKIKRPISSTLKYFTLNYVCVYGGKGVSSKGEGKRKRISMKRGCPAHIKLRANRAGVRLDVVSVCNHHNHTIDPHIYSRLPQGRRLPSDVKPDVYDMLLMGVMKRRVLDYVRWRCGKVLTLKDLINIAALIKNYDAPSQQRRKFLLDSLKKLELENGISTSNRRTEKAVSDTKKRKRWSLKKCKMETIKQEYTTGSATDETVMSVIEQDPALEVTLETENGSDVRETLATELSWSELTELNVDGVIEVHFKDEGEDDSITPRNVMKYLYQSNCSDGHVTILNYEQEIEPSVLSGQHLITPSELCEDQISELIEHEDVVITDHREIELTENPCIGLAEHPSVGVSEFHDVEMTEYRGAELAENTCERKVIVQDINAAPICSVEDHEIHRIWSNCEVILEEKRKNNGYSTKNGLNQCDITFKRNCDADQISLSRTVRLEECNNCQSIKENLNFEVNRLREQKTQLAEEIERLKREKKKLEEKVESLEMRL